MRYFFVKIALIIAADPAEPKSVIKAKNAGWDKKADILDFSSFFRLEDDFTVFLCLLSLPICTPVELFIVILLPWFVGGKIKLQSTIW